MKLPFGRRQETPVPRRRLSTERQARNDALDTTPTTMTFRRNRTLTGSRSADVRSASELSDQIALRSPRATAHHLRAYRRKLSYYLIAGLVVSGLVYGLLNQLTNTVNVTLYGQVAPLAEADKERLHQAIYNYLDQHPIERIRLFMNTDRLVAYFAAHDMREISEITRIDGEGIGKTHLQVKVREPIASWLIGNDRRFVDGTGVIFAHNYFGTPSVRIRDESGISLRGESQATAVTSSRFLRFIGQAVNALNDQGIKVSTVSIPANTTRQVDLLIKDTRIMMTVDRPVGEQSEDAARAWRHLEAKKRKVKYIDVRVGGKAFYR